MKKLLVLVSILILAAAGAFTYLTLGHAQKLAAFSKIEDSKPPLTLTQVEKLMGSPASIEHSETTGITGDVYHYPTSSGDDMKVIFVNGIVFHTQWVPGVKS